MHDNESDEPGLIVHPGDGVLDVPTGTEYPHHEQVVSTVRDRNTHSGVVGVPPQPYSIHGIRGLFQQHTIN